MTHCPIVWRRKEVTEGGRQVDTRQMLDSVYILEFLATVRLRRGGDIRKLIWFEGAIAVPPSLSQCTSTISETHSDCTPPDCLTSWSIAVHVVTWLWVSWAAWSIHIKTQAVRWTVILFNSGVLSLYTGSQSRTKPAVDVVGNRRWKAVASNVGFLRNTQVGVSFSAHVYTFRFVVQDWKHVSSGKPHRWLHAEG